MIPSQTSTRTSTATAIASATSTSTPTCVPLFRQVASPNLGTLSDYLTGVSAVSADDVWAVGYYVADNGIDLQTLTMHWNGSAWSVVPSPNIGTRTNSLRKVSARATNDVWAVGYYFDESFRVHTLTLHWDGNTWNVVSSPDLGTEPNYLNDVSAIASDDVWAVGYAINGNVNKTLTLHWDGSAWSLVSSPNVGGSNNSLDGVSALAGNDVWAVGHYYDGSAMALQNLTMHWDGSAWSTVSAPSSGIGAELLYSVSAYASNDVWAVGYHTQAGSNRTQTLHWNGGAWSVVPSPSIGSSVNELYGVSIVAPDNVWAAGYTYDVTLGPRTLTLHWNGSTWSIVSSENPGALSNKFDAISATASGSVWAVGHTDNHNTEPGRTLAERIEDSCTTVTPIPTTTPISTATPCAISFTDVPPDSTFYTWIRCLACRGIISGYTDGTFRPGNDITRGQIAKIVSNSAGFSEDPGPQIYEDVPVGSPFYDWINRLSMRGHMGGYLCGLVPEEPCIAPDNRPYFRPNATATRGQLAKIVSNAAGLTGTPTGLFYADVPEDHPFYIWIMRLTALGVMGGYPCGTIPEEPCDDANRPYFRPFNNVTRGQASKIVANTFFPNCQTPLK